MFTPSAKIVRRSGVVEESIGTKACCSMESLEERRLFTVFGDLGSGTPLPAPTKVVAKAINPTEIDLSWKDNATNEKKYTIEMGLSAQGPFIVAKTLPANATKVKLKQLLSFTHYFFRVSASNAKNHSDPVAADASTPVPGVETPSNNTLAKAQNIGTLQGPGQFQDFVNDADPIDFIRFKAAQKMTFHGELGGQSDSVTLTLSKIGAGNTLTPIVTKTASFFTPFDQILAAGNYVISFARTAPGDQTAYHMLLEPDFLGNSPFSATKITLGGIKKNFTDTVGPSDPDDCLKFTLRSTKTVNLVLSKLDRPVLVEIHDGGSNQIVFSATAKPGKNPVTFHKKLIAHTWVVIIQSIGSEDGVYTLALSTT